MFEISDSYFVSFQTMFVIDLAVVTHTHLNLKVNFERKMLEGSAILDVEKKGATEFLVSLSS